MIPDFYREEGRVAGNAYLCVECSGRINKGEWYYVGRGKWEGEVRSYRFCSICAEVIGELLSEGADPEILYIGGLRDYLVNDLTDKRRTPKRNRLARFEVNARRRGRDVC